MKYNYQIYNPKTKEVYEKGVTPDYPERVTAHNWVQIKAMDYPLYDRAVQMRAGALDEMEEIR